MQELIIFIYDLFSSWFKPKSRNESQLSRVIRSTTGVLLIILSISTTILCIYLFAKFKNAA